ncbi:hypothetical protein M413DRAFT_68970 [Hebeloma cylindrosporum]|uniref:JmjC domain-containing protein n=1 Tax=Hebeloma cylindrosporum TaxID=76867 RepID=A0A0C3C4L7_HEBCY|nr:hypothetical protein M413DRAFT_68970 [Hebeloma cylindrosporum h7]
MTNNADNLFPTGHVRWGLAATAGARTWWHIDSNGFLTANQVKDGDKIWIVLRDDDDHFIKTCAFDGFKVDEPGKYTMEAILLRPGTVILMRPNTNHMVFTPSHTICHRSHFFSTGSMQDTLRGTIHSFVVHYHITNTNHPPAGMLLRWIALFYHAAFIGNGIDLMEGNFLLLFVWFLYLNVLDHESQHLPNVMTPEGLVDFLSLCFLVIFGNVLDFRTYRCSNSDERQSHLKERYDLNDIGVEERVNMCLARGMCLDLLDWWNANFTLTANLEELPNFTRDFLNKEARNLLSYKLAASEKKQEGADGCTVEDLAGQIINVSGQDQDRMKRWRWNSSTNPAVIGYTDRDLENWVIGKRKVALKFSTSWIRLLAFSSC